MKRPDDVSVTRIDSFTDHMELTVQQRRLAHLWTMTDQDSQMETGYMLKVAVEEEGPKWFGATLGGMRHI